MTRYCFFCLIAIFSAIFAGCNAHLQKTTRNSAPYTFQNGDLLFQDLDCGDLCDAIEKVTKGVHGKSFSHIGLVYARPDSTFVIESIGKNVHLTPVQDFVNRNKDANGKPKIVAGRLKPSYQSLNAPALQYALKQLGTPYDDAFLYDNKKYYCSELLYDAYKAANHNPSLFRAHAHDF